MIPFIIRRVITSTTTAVVAIGIVAPMVGCGSENARYGDSIPPRSVAKQSVVAAGDIASCRSSGDEATARLLVTTKGTVLALGDNAYEDGSVEAFRECYGPTWGRFKDRTRPVPGNHEYFTRGAAGYFGYFEDAAGESSEGYYSYDLGGWHVVALNSNPCVMDVGGCHVLSPQVRWLKADLAANDNTTCTLAYMHHPRFSSGNEHGSTPEVMPLWDTLYEAGADVVLAAHEHNYERFAPQDPVGREDPERGITEFVVGTGGNSHYEIETTLPNSQVHNDDAHGVLTLALYPKSYDWRFVPVEDETFTDSGHGRCH